MLSSKLLKFTKFCKISSKFEIRSFLQVNTFWSRKFSSAHEVPTETEKPVETANTADNSSIDIPIFADIIDSKNDEHSKQPDIVDIDISNMMEEDGEFETTLGINDKSNILKSLDVSGAPVAPVNINAWGDELEQAEGTLDMERLMRPEIEYPPIPEKRQNEFQFKGIRIKLPMRMLQSSTYRYRLDEEDKALADDMHICKF